LKAKLENVGFTQSESDQCLFLSEQVICIIYVDDTLFFSPKVEYIDEVLQKLHKSMELEEEDDVAGFLGVHIHCGKDGGTITLTQQGLIDCIIAAVGTDTMPTKLTPTENMDALEWTEQVRWDTAFTIMLASSECCSTCNSTQGLI
jgi:hypothetical protein